MEHELFGVRAAAEVAGGEEIDARDLELRRGLRARIAADAELREVVREHLRLLEQRRDEAVAGAAVLHAFAEGVDARVVRLHRVAHEHAALARDAARLRERDVRPDADGHHDEVRRQLAAVREAHALHAAVADDRGGLRRHQELEAALLERALQQSAGGAVELPLHQRRHEVHDRDVHAALLQAVRGLEAEQAAADHDRVPVLARRRDHLVDVGDVAVGHDAGQLLARQRQHDGVRAGREDHAVVRHLDAGLRDHAPARAVDLHDFVAGDQRDAVLVVPLARVEHDVVDGLLRREHRRQQDAVVVAVRLRAEHRDVVHVRREREQLLDGAHARHAVADEHELALSLLRPWRPPLRAVARSSLERVVDRQPELVGVGEQLVRAVVGVLQREHHLLGARDELQVELLAEVRRALLRREVVEERDAR